MKNKILYTAFLAVLLLVIQSAPAGTNLLFNPSFEIDDNGDSWPDGWEMWGSGDEQEFINDPAQAHDGNIALRQIADQYALAWTTNTPVTPGEVYTTAAFVKDMFPGGSPSPSEPEFKVEFFVGGTKQSEIVVSLPIIHDGEYHMIYTETECPDGIDAIRTVVATTSGSEYMWDSIWFGYGLPALEGQASAPIPSDGQNSTTYLEQLEWANPEPINPADTITCDVWFTDDYPEYGIDDDPNFATYATKIVDNQPGNTASLAAITLEMDKTYYWRVDCYDPNVAGDPDKYPVIGVVWTFTTYNEAPQVDAGLRQSVWLTASSIDVQLDAEVTDDRMPNDTIDLAWTVEEGPATPVFTPGTTVEDPLVTFNTPGRYVLRLTADDGDLSNYDEVKVDIYEEGYTGLIAHWPLDEESGAAAPDIVGGHNGTLVGGATWMPTDGQVAGAIELDGSGDYIEIIDSADADPINTTWADLDDQVSLSCWIKVNQFTTDYQAIVSKGEGAYRMQRQGETNTLWFIVSPAEDNGGVAGTQSVNDGKWHHVVGTYNGDFVSMFIDGIMDNSVAYAGGIGINESLLLIGENIGYERSFNGMMDEVRLYEIAVTPQMVLDEFKADGGSNSCGQEYKKTDFNQDCYVNITDFAEIALLWLECSDVTNPACVE